MVLFVVGIVSLKAIRGVFSCVTANRIVVQLFQFEYLTTEFPAQEKENLIPH